MKKQDRSKGRSRRQIASRWGRERGELPLPYEPLEAKPPRVLFLSNSLIRKVSIMEKIGFFQGKFVDPGDLGWFNFQLILLWRFMWLKG